MSIRAAKRKGHKRYLVLFKRYLQELYAQGMTFADLELETKRAKFDQHPSPAPIIPTGAMDWIDGWTSHFGDDYYGDATQDVVRVLKQGLGEGWSTEHTMDELRNYLKGPGYNKRRIEVIARTNATSAFNQAGWRHFAKPGISSSSSSSWRSWTAGQQTYVRVEMEDC